MDARTTRMPGLRTNEANYRVPVQLIERNLSQISKVPWAPGGAVRGLAAWPVVRSAAIPARVERAAVTEGRWLSLRSGWVGKISSTGRADRARESWIEREAGNEKARRLAGLGIGSPSWTRTNDPRINSPLLYRLSYRGIGALRGRNSRSRPLPSQGSSMTCATPSSLRPTQRGHRR